jgi:general secretion pathway protein N
MRASSFAALGLAAYAVFLVATIPASYVAAQVTAAMSGRLELADAQGTFWNGSAKASVFPTRGGPTIDRIEWRFAPLRLFAGEVAFATRFSAARFHGSLDAGRSFAQWRARDAKIEGDASVLAAWIPILATWRPTGNIAVDAPSIVIEGQGVRGAATAEWRDASTSLSDVRPLGTYRANWSANDGPGKIAVTTLKGPLRVSGQGTTTPSLRFIFSGEARADPESAKALEPLLDLMGPRRPDGARALELRLD